MRAACYLLLIVAFAAMSCRGNAPTSDETGTTIQRDTAVDRTGVKPPNAEVIDTTLKPESVGP
jgi:hypothetical protein